MSRRPRAGTKEEKLLNCFLDLQRAATSYYLNPRGRTHLVFLDHALKILREIKGIKYRAYKNELRKIKKTLLAKKKEKPVYLADKILTIGIFLKSST